MTDNGTRQVLVINRGTEPKMRRGKEIAQGSHGSLAFIARRLRRAEDNPFNLRRRRSSGTRRYYIDLTAAEEAWLQSGFTKIVCCVDSETELLALRKAARDAGLQSHVIVDAGRTEFTEPTITALAIGPDRDDKIRAVTGHLRLY